jgi:hypothetical protein
MEYCIVMPPTGGIRRSEAAFIKTLRVARPRPSAGWREFMQEIYSSLSAMEGLT